MLNFFFFFFFFFFFCFSDLASLRRECDLAFHNEHMEMFVESNSLGTNCIYKFKYISPVAMLECYFHLANIHSDADKLHFQGLTLTE